MTAKSLPSDDDRADLRGSPLEFERAISVISKPPEPSAEEVAAVRAWQVVDAPTCPSLAAEERAALLAQLFKALTFDEDHLREAAVAIRRGLLDGSAAAAGELQRLRAVNAAAIAWHDNAAPSLDSEEERLLGDLILAVEAANPERYGR